jgi:tetratricopeptide (TPR) repeat protein
LKTESGEHLKPKSQYADEAVRAAIEGRWEDAIDVNQLILDRYGADEEANNRLGKALTELGRYDDAKAAYDQTLAINPLNLIAQKNRAKLDVFALNKEVKVGPTRVDLNLFVEEQGKTTSTSLEDVADPAVHNKVVPGDIAELRVEGDSIVAETVRGVRLGTIEPRLARRLTKFMQGGNRYLAAVTSAEPGSVKLMIREIYQDPQFAGKPSFPMRRKREAEFRPYAKDSLMSRDLEVDTFRDEDEGEEIETGEEAEEDLEGLAVVDDEDEETIDFADGEGEAGDLDEDEDEDGDE